MSIENPYIIPQAEPFYFPGNSTACLLIHGFNGTPMEMRPLGNFLFSQGYTVLGIRLAGHATCIEDMMRMRYWDWLANVEDGINLLQSHSSEIVTIGFSMGGLLSLVAASRFKVVGTIALSVPYYLPDDWRLKLLPLISWIQPQVKKKYTSKNETDALDHIAYPRYPTRSIMELIALQEEMRQILPDIMIPVFLMHSKLDKTALPVSMPKIFGELINSEYKEMQWVEKSGHVITLGPERDLVFRSIHNFINNITKNTSR